MRRWISLIGMVAAVAGATAPAAMATFPGDNGKLVFIRPTPDDFCPLFTVNPDGTAEVRAGACGSFDPRWSADGARLLYGDYQQRAIASNPDGSAVTPVWQAVWAVTGLAWSPDGVTAAVSEDCPIRYPGCAAEYDQLLRVPVDGSLSGTTVVYVGGNWTQMCCPDWSPDGATIAYAYSSTIYMVDAHGGTPVPVTAGTDPSWSPSGDKLAFTRMVGAGSRIFVANADGSGAVQVTTQTSLNGDTAPVWSPDGTKIAFASDRDGDFEIYVMNADGSNVTQVTDNAVLDRQPDWQPIPRAGPTRSDYENAAKFCAAEREFLGAARFRERYGGGANAFGECVSTSH